MSDPRRITCICCPKGCRVVVSSLNEGVAQGQACRRGLEYALSECRSPRRTVTAVVRTNSGSVRYLPVKTDQPLPKPLINGLLRQLYGMRVLLPVSEGDVIVADYQGSGVNVVASSPSE